MEMTPQQYGKKHFRRMWNLQGVLIMRSGRLLYLVGGLHAGVLMEWMAMARAPKAPRSGLPWQHRDGDQLRGAPSELTLEALSASPPLHVLARCRELWVGSPRSRAPAVTKIPSYILKSLLRFNIAFNFENNHGFTRECKKKSAEFHELDDVNRY